METPIKEIKLSLRGAEIIRDKRLNFAIGQHELVFTELSPRVKQLKDSINIMQTLTYKLHLKGIEVIEQEEIGRKAISNAHRGDGIEVLPLTPIKMNILYKRL